VCGPGAARVRGAPVWSGPPCRGASRLCTRAFATRRPDVEHELQPRVWCTRGRSLRGPGDEVCEGRAHPVRARGRTAGLTARSPVAFVRGRRGIAHGVAQGYDTSHKAFRSGNDVRDAWCCSRLQSGVGREPVCGSAGGVDAPQHGGLPHTPPLPRAHTLPDLS